MEGIFLELTEKQKLVTLHRDGPALVLAVPGAGKTTILLHRTLNLIKTGIDAKRILTITFSKAATNEMSKRFSKMSSNLNTNFLTIHAFSYKILLDYARVRGKNYKLIEEKKSLKNQVLKNIYISINNTYPTEDLLDMTSNEISLCKNLLLNPSSFENNFNCQTANFQKIFLSYENYKKENHYIDFDDMLTLTYKILKDDAYFKNKYRSYFDFIQLDEGQDTSYVQFLILKLLAKPKDNIFIVADDDQSIYGFRGAKPDELLKLNETYKDLKIYYMEENFRSSKNIVNISNLFIGQNQNRFKKAICTNNDWKNPVELIKLKNSLDQYEFIRDKLPKLQGSCAILYRNNLSAIGLVEFLERNNIDFNIKDNKNKFFSHFIVRDIIDIINFSNDLSNLALYQKFYYKLEGYISKRHIAYLKNKVTDNIFKELMAYPNLPPYYLKNISKLASDFKILKNMKLSKALSFIQYEMGYNKYLEENAKRLGENMNSISEYLFYISLIGENAKNIDEFIGRLKHLQFLLRKPNDSNINLFLSTIHSSKGLEFTNVFMIDLIDGNIPSKSAIDILPDDTLGLEEERRLFYVAMTRTKENLFLIYPYYRNNIKNEMSRFLIELEGCRDK